MDILNRLAAYSGSAILDAATERVVTYAELSQSASSLAKTLDRREAGLVFCLVDGSVASIVGYLAGLMSRHCVCLIDASMAMPMVERLLDLYQPGWLITPQSQQMFARPLVLNCVDDSGLTLWQLQSAPVGEVNSLNKLLLPTSGSTGNPKMVRLSAQNLDANAASIVEYLELNATERPILSLPIHYSYGLSVLNSHLLAGACLTLTPDSILQATFWDAFRKHECTSFAGVPFQYTSLLRIGLEKFELPSLRSMTQAGGKLADAAVQRIWQRSQNSKSPFRFFVMYGQTEATARMSYLPPGSLPSKLGSAGIAIPGGKFSIHSTEPGSKIGEVVYSGANVGLGYASHRADLTLGDERGGVLHTGDLGYVDDDGYLFITGREGRFAKVFGLRLSLADIEAAIASDVVAVAASECVVICHDANLVDPAATRRQLADKFRIHHSAFKLQAVDAIPLNANGKPDHRLLKERFGGT